jgi:hypothetical protein
MIPNNFCVFSTSLCLFWYLFVSHFVSLSIYLCIFMSLCVFLCLSVPLCLTLSLPVSLDSLCLSLSISVSLCLSLTHSVYLWLTLSIFFSLCLSMSLSVSFCLSLSLRYKNDLILFLMLETIQLCAMISLFSNLTRTPLEGLARNEVKIMNLRMQNIFLFVWKNLVLNSNFL